MLPAVVTAATAKSPKLRYPATAKYPPAPRYGSPALKLFKHEREATNDIQLNLSASEVLMSAAGR
jgi:hypothetical protein